MNEGTNDFLKQNANYAVVVNSDLETIDRLKHFLAEEGIHVIYQRTSLAKLYIKEGNG